MLKLEKTAAALIISALATRFYVLLTQRGFLNYDSVFQLIEPAHYLVFGRGIITWEYVMGVRPLIQTFLFAGIYWLTEFLGLAHTHHVLIFRMLTLVAGFGILYYLYKCSELLYGRNAAYCTMFFSVFSVYLMRWSVEPSSHTPAILFSTAAMYVLFKGLKGREKKSFVLAGMLVGASFVFRFDSLVLLAPYTLFFIWHKKTRETVWFYAGLSAVVLAQGLIDLLFWGGFLHSPIAYFLEVIVKGENYKVFGDHHPLYYLMIIIPHAGAFLALPKAIENRLETRFLVLAVLCVFLIFTVVSHKEMRYILLMLPPVFILSGRGLERLLASKKWLYSIVAVTLVLFVAFDFKLVIPEHYLAAVSYVGSQTDSTGVAYHMAWYHTGGYMTLDKSIPLIAIGEVANDPRMNDITCVKPEIDVYAYQCSPIADVLADGRINYLIETSEEARPFLENNGFKPVKRFGDAVVYRRE